MNSDTLERIANDYYPTPDEITTILLEKIGKDIDHRAVVFDPCAGHGAILKSISDRQEITALGNEPYMPTPDGLKWCRRPAEELELWEELDYATDWVITNPPYDRALMLPIMENSLNCAKKGFAALVRLSWLEPCGDRAEFLQSNADQLRYIMPVSPRPRFRADTKGSDNVTSCWLVWDKSWSWSALGIDCPFVFASGWKK